MKRTEKFWRIKLQIANDKTAYRTLKYEPTEHDIQDFANTMGNFHGEVTVEIIWMIS